VLRHHDLPTSGLLIASSPRSARCLAGLPRTGPAQVGWLPAHLREPAASPSISCFDRVLRSFECQGFGRSDAHAGGGDHGRYGTWPCLMRWHYLSCAKHVPARLSRCGQRWRRAIRAAAGVRQADPAMTVDDLARRAQRDIVAAIQASAAPRLGISKVSPPGWNAWDAAELPAPRRTRRALVELCAATAWRGDSRAPLSCTNARGATSTTLRIPAGVGLLPVEYRTWVRPHNPGHP
jgi:hypothetical protein